LAARIIVGILKYMRKSIRDIPKKRGRPKTTGRGEAVMLRLHPPLINNVDTWIVEQDAPLTRPEAIRRLVELGLKAKK
jgi:hypothetical protein